jgi:thioredoxin reductase (NADPH)
MPEFPALSTAPSTPHGDAPTALAADVAIVGGGPAGMTAALYLARFRRSVVLVDAQQSRLAAVPLSHNYPGFPQGIAGADLLGALRAQLTPYPVAWLHDTAQAAQHTDDGFVVRCTSGTVRSRRLLLATGVRDIAPRAPHMRDALARGALRYCPVCDGYEVRDRTVGVYADGASGVGEALFLRHFTPHVTLFLDGGSAALGPEDAGRLQQAGVRLAAGAVDAIDYCDGRITVTHGPARSTCDSLYCALGLQVHHGLALQLGAACGEDGYVRVDAHGATTVQGLYAAGDVAEGLNQVAVAAGNAAIAATAIHRSLLRGG